MSKQTNKSYDLEEALKVHFQSPEPSLEFVRSLEMQLKGVEEVKEAILPALGKGVPIFGFYAWGELGRIQGDYQGMDHQYQQHTFVSNMVGIKK